jgi:SAM-dependent methyltransferase
VPTSRVVAIGAGASALIPDLLRHGYESIDAVDLSAAALTQLNRMLGDDADRVRTMCADAREVHFDGLVDVWHDRATFHFLTAPADQDAYVCRAANAVAPGGHVVMAGFSPAGPEQCSGLPVARHSRDDLCALFGAHFELVESCCCDHITPWGSTQNFLHALLRRRPT